MTTSVAIRARHSGRPNHVCLVKLPNHNIDYPHLATPTLTARLRADGATVTQVDMNVELHDHLLRHETLERMRAELLPQLLDFNRTQVEEVRRLRRVLEQLHGIAETVSFAKVERQKQQMQQRRYATVFGPANDSPPLAVFNVASTNRVIVDRAIAMAVAGEPNMVSDFLVREAHRLAALRPSVVGISLLQIQRRAAVFFARSMKSLGDQAIVIGGPDATSFGAAYLDAYDCFDAAFLFEAEESFARFVAGEALETIAGVAYRAANGSVQVNPADHDKERSTFLPDFTGLPLDKYLLPTLPISASRGCAFAKCKFCNHFRTYSDYYENDALKTVDNLEVLTERYDTPYFHFVDDMLEHRLGTSIAHEILRRGLELRIMTYARFEPRFDPAELGVWSSAGITLIEWGLESASPAVLKAMSKGISLRRVDALLEAAASVGILSKVLMFHNYPGETVDDLRTSIEFLRARTVDRTLRPFFALRGRFELRLDTPVEIASRTDVSVVGKRFERTSSLSSLVDYHDGPEYDVKRRELDAFLRDMAELTEERSVLPANDDYVSLDLVLQDLESDGVGLSWRAS